MALHSSPGVHVWAQLVGLAVIAVAIGLATSLWWGVAAAGAELVLVGVALERGAVHRGPWTVDGDEEAARAG
jgi:hypothetical protein